MMKDSPGTKPMALTEQNWMKSSKLTLKERQLKENMLLKEMFSMKVKPMAPEKD